MARVILNIGLNNNPLNASQVAQVARKRLGIDRATWATELGKYLEGDEPTLVLHGDTLKALDQITYLIKELSEDLKQECIAVKVDQQGHLLYPETFEGERYEFDQKYFLQILAQ